MSLRTTRPGVGGVGVEVVITISSRLALNERGWRICALHVEIDPYKIFA
jgi:hypothetical protein